MKKALKIIGIALLILISIPLISAIFVKKEYAVEREVTIMAPKQVVFNYIKHLKNQDNYSVWSSMDPQMKKEYKGTDGNVGFISAWESDKKEVGKGEQEILKINEGERIDFELRFYEPFESTDHAYMMTDQVSEAQTRVKWGFNGKFKYPMNFMLLFMDMEEMLAKDLETGLLNLKELLEDPNV